jgi:hypothetical protein
MRRWKRFTYLSFDRCRYIDRYRSVGQFRSAGGLVLLSGRSWGLRFPAAHPALTQSAHKTIAPDPGAWIEGFCIAGSRVVSIRKR